MDAEDFQNISKACIINEGDRSIMPMSVPEYNEESKSLHIKALNGTISVSQMQMIHISGVQDKYSLCDLSSAGWYINASSFNESDLNTSDVTFELISDKYGDVKLGVEILLGDTNDKSMEWSGKDPMINIRIQPFVTEEGVPKFTVPK